MYGVHRTSYIDPVLRKVEWTKTLNLILLYRITATFSTFVPGHCSLGGRQLKQPSDHRIPRKPLVRSRKPMPIAQVLAWFPPAFVCYGIVFSICTPPSLADASPHRPIMVSFMTGLFISPGACEIAHLFVQKPLMGTIWTCVLGPRLSYRRLRGRVHSLGFLGCHGLGMVLSKRISSFPSTPGV